MTYYFVEEKFSLVSRNGERAAAIKTFGTSGIPAGARVTRATLTVDAAGGLGGGELLIAGRSEQTQDVTWMVCPNAENVYQDLPVLFTYQAYDAAVSVSAAVVYSAKLTVEFETGELMEDAAAQAAFSAAALEPERLAIPAARLEFQDGGVLCLCGDEIAGFTVVEGVPEGVPLGTASPSTFRMQVTNTNGAWLLGGAFRGNHALIGAELKLSFIIKVEGDMYMEPIGTFVVEHVSIPEQKPIATLSGSSTVDLALDQPFQDQLRYPQPLSAVLAHIASQARLAVKGTLAANAGTLIPARPEWGEACTLRQALGFVCTAGAVLALPGRKGELLLRPAQAEDAGVQLTPESYLTQTPDEARFVFNRLRVTPRGGGQDLCSAWAESVDELPGNTLYIQDSPLFPAGGSAAGTLCHELTVALEGAAWQGMRVTWRGDPTVTPGRVLRLTDTRGVLHRWPICWQVLTLENRGFRIQSGCTLPLQQLPLNSALTAAGMLDVRRVALASMPGACLQPQSVTAVQLSARCVTADQLAAGAITAEKVQADAIETAHLTAGAITADKIAADAVTAGKIAAGSVTADKIAAGTITADKLAAGLITADCGLIGAAAIGTAQIADGSITDAKIAALSASKITAGTLDAATVNICNLTADNITAGTLNGQRIPVLGTEHIADGAVSGVKIDESAITADKLAANAVTTVKVAAGAIVSDKIAAGAVTADKIAALDGTLEITAGGELKLTSGGRVTIDAEDEESYIRFGGTAENPHFMLGKSGNIVAQEGSFDRITVRQGSLWTAANLTVSAAQPEGHGLLWIRPAQMSTVEYTARAGSQQFGGYQDAQTVAFSGTGSLAGNSFRYGVRLRLYNWGQPRQDVAITVTASRDGQSVVLYQASGLCAGVGDYFVVDTLAAPVASAVNLTGGPVSVTVSVSKQDTRSTLKLEAADTFLLRASSNTGNDCSACDVFWVS